MDLDHNLVRCLFEAGCIQFGKFELKSGIMSPIYIDLRILASRPKILKPLGGFAAKICSEIGCDRIAAIPYAGLPIGTATSLAGEIPMIYPRREKKAYGTGRIIEGEYNKGDKVLVIDDIVTDGTSKIEAIQSLQKAGLFTTDILVVIDREQGGEKILAEAGYQLHSLCTLSEVLEVLESEGMIDSSVRTDTFQFITENQFA